MQHVEAFILARLVSALEQLKKSKYAVVWL